MHQMLISVMVVLMLRIVTFSLVLIGFVATGPAMLNGDTAQDDALQVGQRVEPLSVNRAAPVDGFDRVAPVETTPTQVLTPLVYREARPPEPDMIGQTAAFSSSAVDAAVHGAKPERKTSQNAPGVPATSHEVAQPRSAAAVSTLRPPQNRPTLQVESTTETRDAPPVPVRTPEPRVERAEAPKAERSSKKNPSPTFLIGVYR